MKAFVSFCLAQQITSNNITAMFQNIGDPMLLPVVESSPCSVTNGSVANEGDCTCGNEECTASRGLICYSTIGGGSCRKNDVGAFGYPRPATICLFPF